MLIWVLRGTVRLDFPRRQHLLEPDSLFFIPCGTAFAALPLADCTGEVLLIAPDLTRDLAHPFPARATGGRTDHDDPALRQLLRDLTAEARRDRRHARAAIDCHLGLLALRLDRLTPTARQIQRGRRDSADLPLADRFAALVQMRFADGSTIADLAQELRTTTADLDAACLHAHGKRAIDLAHCLRLRQAVRMLRDTHESTARIAQLLGYSSLAHFSRACVTATGRLPEHLRKTR